MKTRSIGFRLSAWYFLVFAAGIAAFSIAAWFAMRASLYHAIDEALEDRVRGVQTFMERQISSLSVPEIRDEFREHSVLGPGGDLFQVCDVTGQFDDPVEDRLLRAADIVGYAAGAYSCCRRLRGAFSGNEPLLP